MALALLLRLPSFFMPSWYGDEGIFAAVADAMYSGDLLYSETWDNKPPGIFLVYLLGPLTGLDMLVVRGVALLATFATQAIVFNTARRLSGDVAAWVAALLAGLLLGLPIIEGHLVNTETFLVLFTALGIYLLLQRLQPDIDAAALFLPGLAFGAAGLFKQVAVFDAAAAGLFVLLFFRGDRRYAGWFVAGAAALPLLTGFVFWVEGGFGDMWHAVVTSLVAYRGAAPSVQEALVTLLLLAIALPYVISLRPWRTRSVEGLLPLWLAFAAVGVGASGRAYPHYLIQVVPAAVLVAVVWWSSRPRLPSFSVGAGVLVSCLALYHVVLGPWGYIGWNEEPAHTRAYYRQFADYALNRISRADYEAGFDANNPARLKLIREVAAAELESRRVFVWGSLPWIYTDAGLENPLRYATLFNARDGEGSTMAVAELILQNRVPYILVLDEAAEEWREVAWLMNDNYEPAYTFSSATLYRAGPAYGDDIAVLR